MQNHFDRLKRILPAARALEGEARRAYLDRTCGDDLKLRNEVEALLAHDGEWPEILATGGLAGELNAAFGLPAEPEPISLPERIGPYRILGLLGEGGMGRVFEAEQEYPRRRVALKVIRAGFLASSSEIRLFRREIQTLARLRHDSIAALYDAGQTETGQHYFAMELVQGEPLHSFFQDESDGRQETRSHLQRRLELFLRVCEAIQYAHQKSVIHRDLKPGNVLVTRNRDDESGEEGWGVKVLDFGLALLTDSDLTMTTMGTEMGKVRGTLPYMSPEQVTGDLNAIDVRSDVYSLGVLLYELLTGNKPHDLDQTSLPEALHIIRDVDPQRPASINRSLRGDLETIILKALMKAPHRRYNSASSLAEDIRRYLTNQPIMARPPSTSYQLRKLVNRHRVLFGFVVTTFLFLLLFAVTMTVLFQGQRRERARAEMEASKLASVTTFLQDMLSSARPEELGHEVTVRTVLDAAALQLTTDLNEEPEVQAELQRTIGNTYSALGDYEKARPLLESSLATLRRELDGEDLDVTLLLNDLAVVMNRQGDYTGAESIYQEILTVQGEQLPRDHIYMITTLNNLATVFHRQGRMEEAEALLREILTLKQTSGSDGLDIAYSMSNLGAILLEQRRFAEGEVLLRETIELYRQNGAGESINAVKCLGNLATSLLTQEKRSEAEPIYREVLRLKRQIYGKEHPTVAHALHNLAANLSFQGRYLEADPLLRESLAMSGKFLGEEHSEVGSTLNILGSNLAGQGRAEEAETVWLRALEIRRASLGSEHPSVAVTLNSLARFLLEQGRAAEAHPLAEECLRIRSRLKPATSFLVTKARTLLGRCHLEQNQFAAAESLLLTSHGIIMAIERAPQRYKHEICDHLVELYENWDRPEVAERYRRQGEQPEP